MDIKEKIYQIGEIVRKLEGHIFELDMRWDNDDFTDDQMYRYIRMFVKASQNMIAKLILRRDE